MSVARALRAYGYLTIMLYAIADATCRFLRGVEGALIAAQRARRRGGTLKDSIEVYRLLSSPHASGLAIEQAIVIVRKARVHGVEPFDLWMIFDSGICDDLDHAVTKVLEMRAFYSHRDDDEPAEQN